MKGITLVLSTALLAGTAAAQVGISTFDTVKANVARVGVIAPKPPQEEGLELYLPFEADTGATVLDASGNGRDGTAANCVWSSAGPFAGGAMEFNGSNSSIGLPAAPDFPAWNAYSVSVWFRHYGGGYMGAQYGHKIIDKTSMMHDWYLCIYPFASQVGNDIYPAGRLVLGTYEGGGGAGFNVCEDYRDNQWHHAVVIRDGANAQIWVDGILKDSIGNMITVKSTSALCVGNSFSTDAYQRISWNGQIDEVRVYDRALSPAEIGELHTAGLLTPPPVPTAVEVTGDLSLAGDLTVTGKARFRSGIRLAAPLGDLSSGSYTNAPPPAN
ncbi:MAG: LamG domain-containing protein [Kiritimatiellaeota bacterium]|nr:LamG domain-containing protein [Kiritimatiellota bacterium]